VLEKERERSDLEIDRERWGGARGRGIKIANQEWKLMSSCFSQRHKTSYHIEMLVLKFSLVRLTFVHLAG
jgi:hypothetical protein